MLQKFGGPGLKVTKAMQSFIFRKRERNTPGRRLDKISVLYITGLCLPQSIRKKEWSCVHHLCSSICVRPAALPYFQKQFEGIQRLEEWSQRVQHEIPTCGVQGLIIISSFDTNCKTFQSSRDRTGECYLLCCVSTAVSAYAPRRLVGLIYI